MSNPILPTASRPSVARRLVRLSAPPAARIVRTALLTCATSAIVLCAYVGSHLSLHWLHGKGFVNATVFAHLELSIYRPLIWWRHTNSPGARTLPIVERWLFHVGRGQPGTWSDPASRVRRVDHVGEGKRAQAPAGIAARAFAGAVLSDGRLNHIIRAAAWQLILGPFVCGAMMLVLMRRVPAGLMPIAVVGASMALLPAGVLLAKCITDREAAAHGLRISWQAEPVALGIPDDPHRAATAAHPVGNPVSVHWRVDSPSVWPCALVAVIVCAVVLSVSRTDTRGLPWLLFVESAAFGVFLADEPIVLCVCFSVAALAAPVIVGLSGHVAARATAQRLMLQLMAAALMLSVGMGGLVALQGLLYGVPHAPPVAGGQALGPLIERIHELIGTNPYAEVIWRQVSPWVFLAIAGGSLLWLGLFPTHGALTAVQKTGQTAGIVTGCIVPLMGLMALFRVVLPCFPELTARIGVVPFLASAGGVVFLAAALLSPEGANRALHVAPAFGMNLCVAGLMSGSAIAQRGAYLLALGHSASLALYLLSVKQETAARTELRPASAASSGPENGGARRIAVFSLAGAPGLAVFPGLWLILWGIPQAGTLFSAAWILFVLGLGSAWIVFAVMVARESGSPMPTARQHAAGEWSPTMRFLSWGMLIALLFVFGLQPRLVLVNVAHGTEANSSAAPHE